MKSKIIATTSLILGTLIGFTFGSFFKNDVEDRLNLSGQGFGMATVFYGSADTVGHRGYDDPPVNHWQVMLNYYWACHDRYPRNYQDLRNLVRLHAVKLGYVQFEDLNNPGSLANYATARESDYRRDCNYRFQLTYESKSPNEYTVALERQDDKILIAKKRNDRP